MNTNRVILSLDKPVVISSVAKKFELDPGIIKFELEKALKEHYYNFGSRPYTIEFSPTQGYVLKATSTIGRIKTTSLIVDILPKIPNISIGKCLGLAQESNDTLLRINDRKLLNSTLVKESDFSSIDFLGFSLIDSIIKVKNNGFDRKFTENLDESTKGNISIYDTVSEGRSIYKPLGHTIDATIDITPNQILKLALKICLEKSNNEELRNYATLLLANLSSVQTINELDSMILDSHIAFTTPRPDYDKAIAFSKAIIENRAMVSDDSSDTLVPSFSLDLDKVFESYCTNQIQQLIIRDKFEVLAQPEYFHNTEPEFQLKNLVPDIVITNKKTNEKVIIDLKNKYSDLRDNGVISINNPDLFQLCYYSQTLQSKYCVLVYPSSKPSIQYPLRGSEGEDAYSKKKDEKFQKILQSSYVKIFNIQQVHLLIYTIDLSGSLANTKRSVASLCQLVVDLLRQE